MTLQQGISHTLMEWSDKIYPSWQLPILWKEAFHGPLPPVEDCLLLNGQMDGSPAGNFRLADPPFFKIGPQNVALNTLVGNFFIKWTPFLFEFCVGNCSKI